MNIWKWKLIFPTDTLQQKIEITDFFLAGENTSVLIILPTTAYVRCTVQLFLNLSMIETGLLVS